jgi:hypothetical protein
MKSEAKYIDSIGMPPDQRLSEDCVLPFENDQRAR